MCELFAMSSRWPTTVRLSLDAFSRHGSPQGPHHDGWGVGWYADRDVQVVREPHAAADSAYMAFLQSVPFTATLAMSHIRHATRGESALRNCQPFARELGGRMHLFAHNGDLAAINELASAADNVFHPVGETDSERAFCVLLGRLRAQWGDGARPPALHERIAVIAGFAADLRRLGPANFLYSDGEALYAHGHRQRNGGVIRPPGLHLLMRHCAGEAVLQAEGLALHSEATEQAVVLLASVPLTAEGWMPLVEGELVVVQAGRIVARSTPTLTTYL